jgi:peptidoglycan/LPS O-acetylase OafA/YrhL
VAGSRPSRPSPAVPPTAVGSAVAPAPPPAASASPRCAELDAHRGIAALGIVVFHVYQFSNVDHFLYFGTPGYTLLDSLDGMVPWFFVLTAFLLFEPIARSTIEGRPPISVRGFLTRRAIRLLPVYWVAIVVVWFFRQPTLPGDWRDLLEHLTFTQVFDGKRIFYTIGPAWSLSVEVMFYLLLAAMVLAISRVSARIATRRARIALLAVTVATVAAVGIGWKAWAFYGDGQSTTASYTTWFGPVANLDVFAIGLAVAIVVAARGGRHLKQRSRTALRVAGLGVLVVIFASRQANSFTGVYFTLVCAVGFGLLVAAAVLGPSRDRWGRAVARQPLLFIGGISYSLYLWHEPVLLALRGWHGLVRQTPGAFLQDTTVVLTVSLVVGWLSYRILERPTSHIARVFDSSGRLRSRYTDADTTDADHTEWETLASGNPI